MTGHVDAAVGGLQSTIALGDSRYLEEAHYYLAKARLCQVDLRAAHAELRRTTEQKGQLDADARRLLTQVEAFLRER